MINQCVLEKHATWPTVAKGLFLYNGTECNRGLFICFMIKNPFVFPHIQLIFSNWANFVFQTKKGCVSMHLFSDTARYSKPVTFFLLELFKLFAWQTRQQLSITNWTSAKFSVSSFRVASERSTTALKFTFSLVWFKSKDLNISCPEESGPIVAHENLHFSYGNYETKSLKLAD